MYDVMIIDDEQSVRSRLKRMIRWEELGLSLVGEAGDSETARELYMVLRPKIIVTDINIPGISGLELARELSAHDAEIRFIVITGFGDFGYVQDSVALGAVDLLAKPLRPEEVNDSLRKAVAYFEELRERRASSNALRQLVEENLPQLREKYAAYLLNPVSRDGDHSILDRISLLGLDILGAGYTVAILACNMWGLSAEDFEMLLIATKNIADELMEEAGFKRFTFFDSAYRLNCIVSWEDERGGGRLEEVLVGAAEKMMFYYNRRLYAGIGQPVKEPAQLSGCARQAMYAYNYQDVMDTGSIVNYKDVIQLDHQEERDEAGILEQMKRQFIMGRREELLGYLSRHFADITESARQPVPKAREFAFAYASAIISAGLSFGFKPEPVRYSELISKILSSSSIPLLMQYITELTDSVQGFILEQRSRNKNQLIKMAKEYIEENIGDNQLSLETVSSHIGLSSIYFCRLFHKEEGVSFNQYLNERRIQRSKLLLLSTNKKVFEISYELGFGNPKYFSVVFKRLAGVTPLEYRNQG